MEKVPEQMVLDFASIQVQFVFYWYILVRCPKHSVGPFSSEKWKEGSLWNVNIKYAVWYHWPSKIVECHCRFQGDESVKKTGQCLLIFAVSHVTKFVFFLVAFKCPFPPFHDLLAQISLWANIDICTQTRLCLHQYVYSPFSSLLEALGINMSSFVSILRLMESCLEPGNFSSG